VDIQKKLMSREKRKERVQHKNITIGSDTFCVLCVIISGFLPSTPHYHSGPHLVRSKMLLTFLSRTNNIFNICVYLRSSVDFFLCPLRAISVSQNQTITVRSGYDQYNSFLFVTANYRAPLSFGGNCSSIFCTFKFICCVTLSGSSCLSITWELIPRQTSFKSSDV